MPVYSDEKLNYWAGVYGLLNKRYALYATHGLRFEQFIARPKDNERWICIYFANPALFLHRAGGGAVHLDVFLRDASQILAGSLLLQGLADSAPKYRPLLTRQHMACATMRVMQDFLSQEEMDKQTGDAEMIVVHDGRYLQSMKHLEPTAKYKSRGGVHL